MGKKIIIALLFVAILLGNASPALAQTQTLNTVEITRLIEIIKNLLGLINKIKRTPVASRPSIPTHLLSTPTSLSGLNLSPTNPPTPPASSTPVPATPPSAVPTISRVSPSAGGARATITLTGSGFTATGNTVYTGYGEVVRPSNDGRSITFDFAVPGFPTNTALLREHGFPNLPFGFYVRNANGLTAEPGRYLLQP